MRRIFLKQAAAVAASTIAAPYSFAQSGAYPTKPIRVLIGLAPGGSTDPVMRLIQPKLQEFLGQPITIENRPGAGTGIAAGMVKDSPPDGYVLLFTAAGTHVIHTIGTNIKYDPVADFTPIAATSRAGWVFVVHSSLPVKTIPEFVAYCKANPGKVSYASGGIGNANHLAFERFNHATGIKVIHVPYKAGNTAQPDFMAGRVQAQFTTLAVVQGGIASGHYRALAYATAGVENVPPNLTFTAGGLPQFDLQSSTTCLLGPPGLPAPIVNRIAAAVERVIALPEIKKNIIPLQHVAYYEGPQKLHETMKREYEENKQIIKDANIKLEA